jgi:hypothetical protein
MKPEAKKQLQPEVWEESFPPGPRRLTLCSGGFGRTTDSSVPKSSADRRPGKKEERIEIEEILNFTTNSTQYRLSD